MAHAQRKFHPSEIDGERPLARSQPPALPEPIGASSQQSIGGEPTAYVSVEKRNWVAIGIPIILAGTAVGVLLNFVGLLATILIVVGIVAFLAICINWALNNTIEL